MTLLEKIAEWKRRIDAYAEVTAPKNGEEREPYAAGWITGQRAMLENFRQFAEAAQ